MVSPGVGEDFLARRSVFFSENGRFSKTKSPKIDRKVPYQPSRQGPYPGSYSKNRIFGPKSKVRCAGPARPPTRQEGPTPGWAEINYPSVINQLPARASPPLFITEATSTVGSALLGSARGLYLARHLCFIKIYFSAVLLEKRCKCG